MRSASGFEQVFTNAASLASILVGLVAFSIILEYGQPILAPVALAIVIGLMFGPMADRLESLGLPPAISAVVVVLSFLILIMIFALAFAVPLSDWVNRLPLIWDRIRSIVADWKGVMTSVGSLGDQLRELTGNNEGMKVQIDESSTAADLAYLAPNILAQVVIFLASLYFFLSSRHGIRNGILRLCMSRRLRWRVAHIFRDTENLVSRYLMAITVINVCLGAVVALAMFLLGVPSPILWGMLAGTLNYIVYIGPAVMVVILLGVGVSTFTVFPWILAPAAAYLFINFIEAQFVTPSVLGRQMTVSPFIVFLTLVFWLWMWGPIGGFIATPLLLVVSVTIYHIVPIVPSNEMRKR
ncbi:AI-2E family transporter [Pseudohoeflea suaedae]|uniref:AI-2E family transporter n=1 Tax=Pseudohoeflea suaedae TaxID=877384 RepID=UPI0019D58EA3|nr:AI-2E family transporter [Pseudohoeflea suaedae]